MNKKRLLLHFLRKIHFLGNDGYKSSHIAKDRFFLFSNTDYRKLSQNRTVIIYIRRNDFRRSLRIKKARRIGNADSRAARRIACKAIAEQRRRIAPTGAIAEANPIIMQKRKKQSCNAFCAMRSIKSSIAYRMQTH